MSDPVGGDVLGGSPPGIELLGGPIVGQVVIGQSAAELDIFNVMVPPGKISTGGQIIGYATGIIVNTSGVAQNAQLRLRYGASVITPPVKSLSTGTNMREEPSAELSYQGGPSLNNGFVCWWEYPTLYAQAALNANSQLPQAFRLTIQFGVANAALYFLRTSAYVVFIPPGGLTP